MPIGVRQLLDHHFLRVLGLRYSSWPAQRHGRCSHAWLYSVPGVVLDAGVRQPVLPHEQEALL